MKQTFENFYVNKSNELAHAAALAVTECPGKCYNPLIICGATSYGKTHLVNAMKSAMEEQHALKVVVADAIQLMQMWVEELKKSIGEQETIPSMSNWFREADVVILEDIVDLNGRTTAQEEMGKLVVELVNFGKQVICTSTKYVRHRAIETFMIPIWWKCNIMLDVNILAPETELKMRFLEDLLEELQIQLGEEERKLLVYRTVTKRQMEAVLKQAKLLSKMHGCEIHMAILEQVFSQRQI